MIRKTEGTIIKKIVFEPLKFSLQIKVINISNENYKFLQCAGLASVLMVYLWPNRNWWYQCQLQIYPLSLSLTLCPTPVSWYAHSCRQFRPESNEWWCFQVHNGEKFFIKYSLQALRAWILEFEMSVHRICEFDPF